MPDNVVYAGTYIRFIKSKTRPILGDGEVLDICTRIQQGRLKPSIETYIDHVKHVNTVAAEKQSQKVFRVEQIYRAADPLALD